MNLNIYQLLTSFSSFLLFLLGTVFIFYPYGKKISNYLLGAFMLSNAVLLGNLFFFLVFPDYRLHFQLINIIGYHSYLLLAPLLYLYINSLCKSDYQFKIKASLHFLPFFSIVCLDFFITHFSKELAALFPKAGYYFYLIYRPGLYFQIAVYIIASYEVLRIYRFQLKELYSSIIKMDLQWINLVLSFLILMWSLDVIILIVNTFNLVSLSISHLLPYLTVSTNLILCISLIYKGMRQTKMPSGIQALPKYGQNMTDVSIYYDYQKQLNQIMEKEKLFLLPELSLDDLASKLNIPPKQLSQTIHLCFNQNFNYYINHHRVEEAKRLMESDKQNKKKLFAILNEAGFNSKSVFNESFKKITGLTPKDYRQKLTNNSVLNPESSR